MRMSSPDVIDPRFDELVAELRHARPSAPEALRARVEALTGEEPAAPRRSPGLGWRRGGLVLVPVVLSAIAAAVVIGVVDSGDRGPSQERTALRQPPPAPKQPAAGADQKATAAPLLKPVRSAAEAAPAASTTRAQLYEADLTVRVKDVSAATKRALNLTRSFGGYVRTVEYGKGTASGRADLVVRVPVGSVQEAIVRFSGLGTIVDQQVSIQDIQSSIDRRFRRLQALRVQIATLQEQLAASGLTEEEKAVLNARLARARAQLTALQREQAQVQKRASFATVSLGLRTKAAQVVPPAKPSRLDRTLDRIGDVLLVELEVLLYVLAIALPLVALVALVVWGRRAGRRRAEDRLLAR
jgi:hypothetical protein